MSGMGYRTFKWGLSIARQRIFCYVWVRRIAKRSNWALVLQKRKCDRSLTKVFFGTMRFQKFESMQMTPFSAGRFSSALSGSCASEFRPKVPTTGEGELSPFHGLLPPQIWRPFTTGLWENWKILYIRSLSKNTSELITKMTQAMQMLTRILWKSLRKVGKYFTLCIERRGRSFQISSILQPSMLLRISCIIEHPNRLKSFKIIAFNFLLYF